MAVFAVVLAVGQVIGTHHRLHIGVLDADFEGKQVGFAASAVIDDGVGGGAAGFLVVEGEMLDVGNDVLGLDGVEVGGRDFAGEDGVFALGFEGAAVARLASDEVAVAAEVDVDAVVGELGADNVAVLGGFGGVPAGGAGEGGRERCRGTDAIAYSDTAVGEVEGGDVQRWNAGDVAGCAAGDGVALGEIGGDAAHDELEFLCLGHLGFQGGGAGVRGLVDAEAGRCCTRERDGLGGSG